MPSLSNVPNEVISNVCPYFFRFKQLQDKPHSQASAPAKDAEEIPFGTTPPEIRLEISIN
jgi:hypothetical protein